MASRWDRQLFTAAWTWGDYEECIHTQNASTLSVENSPSMGMLRPVGKLFGENWKGQITVGDLGAGNCGGEDMKINTVKIKEPRTSSTRC